MSDTNKRKNNNEVNKKPKALVKLGGNSNERYDSYGHIIEEKKPDIPRSFEQKRTPGRDSKRAGESVYAQKDSVRKPTQNSTKERQTGSYERTKKNRNQKGVDNAGNRKRKIAENEKAPVGKEIRDSKVAKKQNPKDDSPKRNLYSKNNKSSNDSKIDSEENQYTDITEENKNVNKKSNRREIKNVNKKNSGAKEEVLDNNQKPHERRLNSRKSKRNKNIVKILKISALLMIVIVTICLFWFAGNDDDEIRKAFLSTGSIESTISSQVCVIKNETAIVSDFSGKVIPKVNEGDRVKAGTVVAYIIKPEYESELVALRKIEDKITSAQKVSTYVENEHMELSDLNNQIYGEAKALAMLSAENANFSKYTEFKHNIEALFETKHEILMNVETTDSYITELKNQRSEILGNLSNYMSEMVTTEAGIVSFYTDASCNEASNKMMQISNYVNNKGQTANILNESDLIFAGNSMKNMQGLEVSNGQTIARVTPDVKYYLSASVETKDVGHFYQGKTIEVRSKDRSFSVEGVVEDILKYGDKTYVLVESSSGNTGIISSRIMDAEIVVESAEGLKVPKRALTEWDSARLTARISILRSNYVSYVFVNVLAEDGEYAIIAPSNGFVSEEDAEDDITSVRVNDIYVVNYEQVTEGQIIGG